MKTDFAPQMWEKAHQASAVLEGFESREALLAGAYALVTAFERFRAERSEEDLVDTLSRIIEQAQSARSHERARHLERDLTTKILDDLRKEGAK